MWERGSKLSVLILCIGVPWAAMAERVGIALGQVLQSLSAPSFPVCGGLRHILLAQPLLPLEDLWAWDRRLLC